MRRVKYLAVSATLAVSTLATSSTFAQPRGCYGVWVTPITTHPQSEPRARRTFGFSASEVLDLRFLVLVPASRNASDVVYLKLFTPKGHLYQKLRLPRDPVAFGQTRHGRRSRYRWVSSSLPVAGTSIVTSSLYGMWRAEPYVEGQSAPCARVRRFVIRE